MSRGRGRPPGIMLVEAEAFALRRGEVYLIPGGRSDDFDLIVFEEFRNVFVRCRGSATNLFHTIEVLDRCYRDIARMSRMPRSKVAAWEFWLRLPRGKWLFFLVTHDGIAEIRVDGTLMYRPVLPVPVREERGEAAAGPEECPDGEGDFTPEDKD